MTSPASNFRLFLPLLVLIALPATADDSLFPQPPELDRDVNFWISIFTDYTTRDGVLHDSRNLAVVYERIDLPENASRSTRNRLTKKRRSHYQAILRKLAGGQRANLSEEEQRVLDLWPDDVTNDELRAATGSIRFQLGLADRFQEGLVRAGRWRQHVNAEFTKLGVPVDIAALPHVESSYNPEARSHVGASGIWQFTRGTGRRFMQVDHVLDERNDPFLATEAAGKLMAYNYSITGNWPMAITAYNHGLAGAKRAMRQFGDEAYVKILREYRGRTFGFASRNFYVAFLAARHVDQNVERYFPGVVPDKPIDYQRVTLNEYISVDAFAKAAGISERDVGRYNPALQQTIFQGSKHLPKGFELRVPQSRLSGSLADLVAAIPEDQRFDKQLPDLYHTVVRGDTLSEIADEYSTRVSTLVALNGLGSRHRIRIGQRIRLPAAGPAPQVVAQREAEAPPAPTPQPEPLPEPEPEPEVVAAAAAPATEPMIEAGDISEEPVIEAGVMSEEPVEAVAVASTEVPTQQSILSDPSDYTVSEDLTIEVHPLETLGHYGDWLDIKTQRLRDANGLAFRTPVEVGQRIKLVVEDVDVETFENLRIAYHRNQQDAFFRKHTITGIREHIVGRGESVWILSLRQYRVPIWLFRQYNPELDLHNVRPGTRINFPVLVESS